MGACQQLLVGALIATAPLTCKLRTVTPPLTLRCAAHVSSCARGATLQRALDTALRLSGGNAAASAAVARQAATLTLTADAVPPEAVVADGAYMAGGGSSLVRAAAAVAALEQHASLVHRIDALDCVRLHLPVPPPLTRLLTPTSMAAYQQVLALVLRTQRATDALGELWTRLRCRAPSAVEPRRGSADASVLAAAHAWHVLRLHVSELRHFVNLVRLHLIAGVCERLWGELLAELHVAASPAHVRRAHDAFVRRATEHCLLHPKGEACGALIASVFSLALSLHREVCCKSDDEAQDDESAVEVRGGGVSWAVLVDASRRQYARLLASLARQPLVPPELVTSL